MRRHAAALAALVLAVGSASGCAELNTTGVPADGSEPTGVAESIGPQVDPLVGTAWQLTASSLDSVDLAAFGITAEFAEGTLSGQAPVNRYNAAYEVDGESIEIGPIASTKMAGQPAAMAAEGAFFALLSTVTGFEQTSEELVLLAEEAPVLEFEPAGAEGSGDEGAEPQTEEEAATAAFAESIVGMTAQEAQEAVEAEGLTYRVLSEDGQENAVTADYRSDRINVEIEDGTVTAATVG
jgi:heat shock protein HslJ